MGTPPVGEPSSHGGSRDVGGGPGAPVSWESPASPSDEAELEPWRRAVGPALTASPTSPGPDAGAHSFSVAVWNARVGGGALGAWYRAVRDRADPGPVVLLVQEVYSSGDHVPDPIPLGARLAGEIADAPPSGARTDVASFARSEGLALFYAPSMRNGPGREDRGNAVLSNAPLSRLRAIELPFERQRRVAVAASLRLGDVDLSVCSVHLDNRAPWRRAWRSLGRARGRQMKGLLERLTVNGLAALGGDLNTWVGGIREEAFRLARHRYPDPSELDERPTHLFEIGSIPRRSDHLLFALGDGWEARVERMDDRFGSDHYPLLARVSPAP